MSGVGGLRPSSATERGVWANDWYRVYTGAALTRTTHLLIDNGERTACREVCVSAISKDPEPGWRRCRMCMRTAAARAYEEAL